MKLIFTGFFNEINFLWFSVFDGFENATRASDPMSRICAILQLCQITWPTFTSLCVEYVVAQATILSFM